MKSRTVVASMLVVLLMAPSIASAQSTTNRPPPGPVGRMTQQQESWRFESEEMRRQNAMTPEEAEAEYGAERVALANRVQALIDEGKCREARALANEAGERQMALRIRQTCRSR